MELRVLRYFLAVAREENITRAAESLHIAQPSLSKQLIDLEQELGKPLLIRGKRKITLTEEGVLLRKRAEEILQLVSKTEQEITSDAQQLSGEISIGGGGHIRILQTAAELRKRHPDVRFNFYSSDATDVTERLDHGSLDFAVSLVPTDPVKYESFLLPERSFWGLLVRADSPLAENTCVHREELLTQPLILHRRAGLQRVIADWAQTEPERLNIAATYNVVHWTALPLARSGLGSLLITRDLLDTELDPSVRFLPLDPPLETQYALIWKRHAALSKAAKAFLALLQAKNDIEP